MEDRTPEAVSQRGEHLSISQLSARREIAGAAIDGGGIPYGDNGHFRSEMAQLRTALDAALAEIADLRTSTPPPPVGTLDTLESGLLEADSARLRAQVLAARNADLTAALDAAMTEMASFVAERAAMDSKRQEIAALRDQLATAQLALESHNTSMDEFAATRLELDMLRDDHQRQVFNLQTKLDGTEAALKRARIELDSLAGEREEVASLRARLDRTDLERARLNDEIERLRGLHAAAQREVDNIRAQSADNSRLRDSLESAKSALEQAATANDANEAEIARLQKELRDANDALLAAVATRDAANAAGERLQAELADIRNELQKHLDASAELHARFAEISTRHEQAMEQQQRLLQIEEQFNTARSETEQLRAELATRAQAQAESIQTIELLHTDLESLREERDALRSSADELSTVAAARDRARSELEQSIAAKTRVDEECERLRTQVAELAAANHELHSARKELQAEAEQHQLSAAAATAQLEMLGAERDEISTQLLTEKEVSAHLNTELARTQAAVSDRDSDIEQLQRELAQLATKEQELQSERSESNRLRSHLTTLALMSADAEVGSARLRRQHLHLQRRLDSTRETLAGAMARGAALEDTSAALKLREDELQAARELLIETHTRIEQLQAQLAEAEKNNQTLHIDLADAKERAARRNAHAETLQSQMDASTAEARNRIEKLRNEIEQISVMLRQKEGEAATHRHQADVAAERIGEMDARLRQSEDANGELNRKLADMEESLRKREREAAELKADLSTMRAQADEQGRLRLQLDDANRKLDELRRTADCADSLRSDVTRLGALADRQQQELDYLRQQLTEADASQGRVKPMQEELVRVNAELAAIREQASRAEASAKQHLEQVANLQRQLKDAEAEIARLRNSSTSADSNELKRMKARMEAQAENRQRQLEELAAARRGLAEADAQRRQLQTELEALKSRR